MILSKILLPKQVRHLRYIDDVLLIYSHDIDLHDLVDKLDKIENSVEFTYEMLENNTLPFLDMMLNCVDNSLKLSVH